MKLTSSTIFACMFSVATAHAATVQIDATASGANSSGGTDTISITAVFDSATAPESAGSTGHDFPAAGLVSATANWTIGGVSSSFSYDPTGVASTPANLQQYENSTFGPGQQIFNFSFNCRGSFCSPFPVAASIHIKPESATINNVLWDTTDNLLENVLDGPANDFSNYLLESLGAGTQGSFLRIGGTSLALTSVSWSDPNATTPPPSAVPLPAGLPLLVAGLGVLGVLRRRV